MALLLLFNILPSTLAKFVLFLYKPFVWSFQSQPALRWNSFLPISNFITIRAGLGQEASIKYYPLIQHTLWPQCFIFRHRKFIVIIIPTQTQNIYQCSAIFQDHRNYYKPALPSFESRARQSFLHNLPDSLSTVSKPFHKLLSHIGHSC